MLKIDYRAEDLRATLTWEPSDERTPWLELLRRIAFDHSDDTTQEDAYCFSLPWWSFVSLRGKFAEVFSNYEIKLGSELSVSSAAAELLKKSRTATDGYSLAVNSQTVSEALLVSKLDELKFDRPLTDKQKRNVGKMAAMPAAATFSVPGAGKTTEALAWFFYKAKPDDRLLVIAPKNAFAAWDEQIHDCMPHLGATFTRLRYGKEKIAKQLEDDPRFMLITYQQLTRVADIIAAHCARYGTFIFLDESHRIKSGVAKQTARAVLGLSHLPIGKLIMSGTPMPQATDDLIPQFAFLYPEISADADNVVDLMRPIYVRTNKKELELPDVTRHLISLPMAPVQYELYNLMKFEVAREAKQALTIKNKQAFRQLGRSVARLLQFVSNPSLLSAQLQFAHPEMLASVLAEGDGPKIAYVLKRARQLARSGQKVLIWSSFVRNVEYLASRLADLGAVYIHGGVDAGDEADDDTREGKIRLFHDDDNVKIMVANPAAASEGVSLHRICHHAIYLDRTFNAAHYLQSEDRIHRYGLKPGQSTTIEIVECEETVDETVRERLKFKTEKMAEALEDSSLRIDPIPMDPNNADDAEDLLIDDIRLLVKNIMGTSA